MTVREALTKLNELIDESDPDSDLPNIVHAFQTAEKIRADHPREDWFHLTGLIHDMGKVTNWFLRPLEADTYDKNLNDYFHICR